MGTDLDAKTLQKCGRRGPAYKHPDVVVLQLLGGLSDPKHHGAASHLHHLGAEQNPEPAGRNGLLKVPLIGSATRETGGFETNDQVYGGLSYRF